MSLAQAPGSRKTKQMAHTQRSGGDEWEWERLRLSFTSQPTGEHADDQPESATTDVEPGWRAARALMQVKSDELLAVMLRPSFRPVREVELVPVIPCHYCLDGGLRVAGTVRTRHGRGLVRACDTCAKVEIEQPPHPARSK
jgi:hypothetical protein